MNSPSSALPTTYRHLVEYRSREPLPRNSRPLVRYHEEKFGYLAAFPDGHVAMLDSDAEPLLRTGPSYEECRPHFLTSIDVERRFRFSAPLLAWLEITRRCNLTCPHCFVEGGSKRAGELSTERILSLLDEWAAMGVFSVVLTGGEPSMHPDFLTILHHAHSAGMTVGIATNGMATNPRILEGIPRDDVIVSVSLDELHHPSGDPEREFEQVAEKVLRAQAAGYHTSLMTTTTRRNTERLSTYIDWAREHRVSLRSVPFVPMGRGAIYRELQNTSADVELAARFWIAEEEWEREKDRDLGLCTGKVFNFLLTMVYACRRCMSGRGVCYVDSSGDVYPCTTCSGGRTLCGGNVRMSSFRSIWEDDDWAIRDITWDDFRETCAGCPLDHEEYFCTGRCPGSSNIFRGRLDGCGMSEFQRRSVLRREELFRQRVHLQPAVAVRREPRREEKGNPTSTPISASAGKD